MRPRPIAMLVTAAAATAFSATGPNAAAAEQRHPPHERIQAKAATPPHPRHARQMDTNDVAGRGAWLGCAAHHASAGTKESASLVAIYCGRAPVFLASADDAVAIGAVA